ncbi:MAG TPA: glycosyltransferase family 2 protein, partial [Ktedonobacteraceae bacterium]|nr:glycosyltransferase family 2 protein [Ktedonobacteraceae bacterium]
MQPAVEGGIMQPLVTIAIPDIAGPAARGATLASLSYHTPRELHEVILLVEATRGQDRLVTSEQHALRQLAVPAPFGAPAALNRLLAECVTPYVLLLESGAVVTHGWLERLLAPLDDPAVGLCGPSTNLCWNEQQVVAQSQARYSTLWSNTQINTYAASIAARYAQQRRALNTLHSLNDFCYLFRRQVAEDLGGFEEAYGAGPCWEIDFNTRAALAGFRSIWVADAYVHRTPQPARRRWNELFATSKQIYQDRFCGLRLRGEKTTYESHCRGEDCPHFAPRELIQVKLQREFVADGRDYSERDAAAQLQASTSPPPEHREPLQAQSVSVQASALREVEKMMPLVSCIMPTHNRRAFILQALMYFERQDYPRKELIIVDDGDDPVADLIADKPYVHYIALPRKATIGEKRNLACQHARGTIIAHWDDDDWYAPHRLSHQVAPLLTDQADITGMETFRFFDVAHWQAWTCTPELHQRLFVGDVHGGTIVYHRSIWERLAKYPQVS